MKVQCSIKPELSFIEITDMLASQKYFDASQS